jgi:PAS domain S-box-containing protein
MTVGRRLSSLVISKGKKIQKMGENDLIKMLEPKIAKTSMRSKSTRWPQFIIFFNGLILTIAATITLFIYIEQITESDRQETIQSLVSDIENTITHAYSLFQLEAIAQQQTHHDLLSLTKISQNKLSGAWGANTLYGKDHINNDLIRKIIKTIKTDATNAILPHNNQIFFTHLNKDESISLALLNPETLQKVLKNPIYSSIEKMRLFDKTSDTPSFSYRNNKKDLNLKTSIIHRNHSQKILNSNFQITLELFESNGFFLSNKLPIIIFLFGGGLTILGTLFVRNNQRQSQQMHLMNEILADKNQSLEYKIDEAQSISKALRESEDEYKAVVNSVQDILFELDITGQIVFLNASWNRITGLNPEDVYGESLFKLLHPQDITTVQNSFFNFIKTKKYTKLIAKIQTLSGEFRSVDIAFSVLRNDTDDTPHIIGTITDVEEKRRVERALNEAEKRSRKIVENAAGGIYQIAPNGTIMSANPSFLNILGYNNLDEITAETFNIHDSYINDEDRTKYKNELLRNDQIRNYEVQMRHANGKTVWINENARAVKDEDGTLLYYEGSIEDITQRKEAEIALIEAKLNSDLASRAKSEFLANMSHELRTPLNSIIGFSEIIKGEALGEIENKPYVDYAKDIHNSGTRLLNVINEILGISKIEAGERQLNESIVNIHHVSQTCIDLMANKIENRHIQINNLIDEDTPHIVAEELAFKQILMNLMSNAIKFTPENGSITLSSDYDGKDLRFSITDTGVGIDEIDIPKALSPFGQVDNTLARSNVGTGLGLTLVDSLIRLHDGSLELISQKGFGTTVTLTIPEKRVAAKKEKSSDKDTNIKNFSDYK